MAVQTAHDLRNFLMAGKPSGTWFETIPRSTAISDVAIAASGVMLNVACPMTQGAVVSKVTFVTGATAASTPTNGFVALYGPNVGAQPAPLNVLLAQSADQLTTARAANTVYTISFATAYTIPTTDVYQIAISFTGTTIPTVLGQAAVGLNATSIIAVLAAFTSFPAIAQTSGSAVAGTPPATITSPTNVLTVPWMVVQ